MKGSPQMSSGITNPTTSDTIDKVLANTAQLHRLLREEGLSDDARQRVIDDPIFRAELVRFWNGDRPASPDKFVSIEQAYLIMGKNAHGMPELERHLGVRLSAKSKKLFTKVPFSTETLMACRDTHVLVACGALSLMDVWQAQSSLFYIKSDPWFGGSREPWARFRVKAGWQLVRKSALPDSFGKTWDEQNVLLRHDEHVPNASVLAQAILIHYLETEEQLFDMTYVRCSDVDPDSKHIYIGFFDFEQGGLRVRNCWDGSFRIRCGLASSRNFS